MSPISIPWLKEMGYNNYTKSDTHTINILYGIGITQSQDNYTAYKAMVRMGRLNDEMPTVIVYVIIFKMQIKIRSLDLTNLL
jgi:hypothetical protein